MLLGFEPPLQFVLAALMSVALPGFAHRDADPGSFGAGSLSQNQVIHSEALGYDLQYRVYLPANYEEVSGLPVLYVTDGQWYIDPGMTPRVLDQLIEQRAIKPVIAVFIDNRDPANLNINRRNDQFFCNRRYIEFVSGELVAHIDDQYKTRPTADGRVILGLSFGGLNSACFGLAAYEFIGGVAMQSPALHPVPNIIREYERSPKRPLKVFLSTGTVNDNEATTRRFKSVLEEKGYDISYVEVPFGHNWRNWGPLLDDVLTFFFGTGVSPN